MAAQLAPIDPFTYYHGGDGRAPSHQANLGIVPPTEASAPLQQEPIRHGSRHHHHRRHAPGQLLCQTSALANLTGQEPQRRSHERSSPSARGLHMAAGPVSDYTYQPPETPELGKSFHITCYFLRKMLSFDQTLLSDSSQNDLLRSLHREAKIPFVCLQPPLQSRCCPSHQRSLHPARKLRTSYLRPPRLARTAYSFSIISRHMWQCLFIFCQDPKRGA